MLQLPKWAAVPWLRCQGIPALRGKGVAAS